MARIRTVKPEMPQDVKLASVSRDARLTFVYLITQADDEGLVPAAHRQLLGLLYPHDDAVTTAHLLEWIEELVSIEVIRWRATVDGAPILEITNWSKHQRVDNKGKSSFSNVLAPLPPSRGEIPRTAASGGDSPLGEGVGVGEGIGVGMGGGKAPRPAAVMGPCETQLAEQLGGEHWPAVKAFLDERPPRNREDWAKEGLKLVAGGGLNLPEDLAQGWTDARLATPPVTNAGGARAFVDTARRARLKKHLETAGETPGTDRITAELRQWARDTDAKEKARA